MEIEKQIATLLNGYEPASAIIAANEVGLFEALKKPTSAEKVASRLKYPVKGVERLLFALTALGVVAREGSRFYLAEGWRKFLLKDGERSMHHWIRLIGKVQKVWTDLPEFIQSGRNPANIMEMLGNEPENMRAFIDAMHDKALKATSLIAREIPLGTYRRMLDLGGGPGTYALEWARTQLELTATIWDIEPVTQVAQDYIARYGLAERVGVKAGDFHEDDLGEGYDLVLLANVLHMYDKDKSKALVAKAANAICGGGRIIIHGFATDKTQTEPLADALFNINMGLLTESGRAHPLPEIKGWVEAAGVKEVQTFRIDAVPTGVITGVKPA